MDKNTQMHSQLHQRDLLRSFMFLFTSCRDPADNTPAPPDWRTPSNCANLPAPRDTRVQLRTASLVEPTHHVSAALLLFALSSFELFYVLHLFPSAQPPLLLCIPFFFFLFFWCLSDLNKLCCPVPVFLSPSL